jgi:hypothetical protein
MSSALDTPAKIAVLGAGPIGLEAALYARYLGYTVDVYECGRVGQAVFDRGHLLLPGEFSSHSSPLALAALAAQDPEWQPPGGDERLDGRNYAQRYLLPLAQSDLLDESIHEGTTVLAVGVDRAALAAEADGEADEPMADEGGPADAEDDMTDALDDSEESLASRPPAFYLLIEDADGERMVTADAVLDATGLTGPPLGLGPGCIPAAGERRAAGHFDRGVPDILGSERDRFAGRRVLVVGSGSDAADNVIALCQLAADSGETRVAWIEPSNISGSFGEERGANLSAARAAIASHGEFLPGAAIERVRFRKSEQQFTVRLYGAGERKRKFDRVLVSGPKSATSLLVRSSAAGSQSTDQSPALPPRFHVLGAKSRQDGGAFAFIDGLDQIRRVFAILGDRAGLDLYRTLTSDAGIRAAE